MNKDWGGNKRTTYAQLGASNHCEHERETDDYYATDPVAIDRFVKVYDIPHDLIEVSAGENHLANKLKKYGHNVITWDIKQRSQPLDAVQDFLTVKSIPKGYSILTNPPFNKAMEFVLHALELLEDGNQAIFFLKIQFLESQKRFDELYSKYPPKYVYIATQRIVCAMNGEFVVNGKKQSSAVAYAFFVWEKGYSGEPTIRWF